MTMASSLGTSLDKLRRIAWTVAEAFGIFDEALNLDTRERDAARSRFAEVRDCLVAAGVAVDAFLQGSFARKTMLTPLKDVDVVLLLPASWRYLLSDPNGPARAMASLRGPLQERFPGVAFDVSDTPAKALQVTFPDLSFTFDLVVAFESSPGDERVLIGNRKSGEWEYSNTRILNRLIQQRNVATGGVWVHQARGFKAMKKNNPVLREHCGLLFESLLYHSVPVRMAYPKALATALEYAATAVLGPVFDPTGEDDLTAEWTPAVRAATASAFATASRQANEALTLAVDREESAAVGVWHDVIGDPFPIPPTTSVDDTFKALAGGSITSRGDAVKSMRGREPVRPGRSWRSC